MPYIYRLNESFVTEFGDLQKIVADTPLGSIEPKTGWDGSPSGWFWLLHESEQAPILRQVGIELEAEFVLSGESLTGAVTVKIIAFGSRSDYSVSYTRTVGARTADSFSDISVEWIRAMLAEAYRVTMQVDEELLERIERHELACALLMEEIREQLSP